MTMVITSTVPVPKIRIIVAGVRADVAIVIRIIEISGLCRKVVDVNSVKIIIYCWRVDDYWRWRNRIIILNWILRSYT